VNLSHSIIVVWVVVLICRFPFYGYIYEDVELATSKIDVFIISLYLLRLRFLTPYRDANNKQEIDGKRKESSQKTSDAYASVQLIETER